MSEKSFLNLIREYSLFIDLSALGKGRQKVKVYFEYLNNYLES